MQFQIRVPNMSCNALRDDRARHCVHGQAKEHFSIFRIPVALYSEPSGPVALFIMHAATRPMLSNL